jgi:hypothetical protein
MMQYRKTSGMRVGVMLQGSSKHDSEFYEDRIACDTWLGRGVFFSATSRSAAYSLRVEEKKHIVQGGLMVRCWPPSWEPQDEGMMSTAASFPQL